jgi:hypothetical protein
MAFIPLKNFFSIRHFKLIGLIGPRAVGERVKNSEGRGGASIMQMGSQIQHGTGVDRDLCCVSKATTSSKGFLLKKSDKPTDIYFLCFVHNAVCFSPM